MAETDQMLRTVLVMQAEILSRISKLEQQVKRSNNPQATSSPAGLATRLGGSRSDCLAELESLMDSDLGDSLRTELQDLVDKVNGAR